MATLTTRNVRPSVVKVLKERARSKGHSMEQEVRELLEQNYVNRQEVLDRIERMVAKQSRPTTPEEIERWIQTGRE